MTTNSGIADGFMLVKKLDKRSDKWALHIWYGMRMFGKTRNNPADWTQFPYQWLHKNIFNSGAFTIGFGSGISESFNLIQKYTKIFSLDHVTLRQGWTLGTIMLYPAFIGIIGPSLNRAWGLLNIIYLFDPRSYIMWYIININMHCAL
jgi:hypothetical protein